MRLSLPIFLAGSLASSALAGLDPVNQRDRHLLSAATGAVATPADMAALKAECGDVNYSLQINMDSVHFSLLAEPLNNNADIDAQNDMGRCESVYIDLAAPSNKRMILIDNKDIEEKLADFNRFEVKTLPLNKILGAFHKAKTNDAEYDAITNNCGKIALEMSQLLEVDITDEMVNFVASNMADELDKDVDKSYFRQLMVKSPAFDEMEAFVGENLGGDNSFAKAFVEFSLYKMMSDNDKEEAGGQNRRLRGAVP